MNNQLKLIEAVAPDVLDIVQERFNIMRHIHWMAPVGRRTLATKMEIGRAHV